MRLDGGRLVELAEGGDDRGREVDDPVPRRGPPPVEQPASAAAPTASHRRTVRRSTGSSSITASPHRPRRHRCSLPWSPASFEGILDDARIFHTNINCSDLARSRAFYVDGCGLAEGVRTTPAQSQPGSAFGLVQARWDAWILVGANGFDGGAIDLLEWQDPAPTGAPPRLLNAAGFQRIGLLVPDLDAARASAEAYGGVLWSEPMEHVLPDGGGVRIAFVSDPDGVAVELVEGAAGRLSFVGVACRDLERSVAFYRALGFRELARFPSARDDGTPLRVDGPVSMVEALMGAPGRGEVQLMLVGFDRPAVQPAESRPANALGMWRMALVLPDLDRAVSALREAGIALMSDPQEMGMGPGLPELRFVCFRGPDHEVIELIEQP